MELTTLDIALFYGCCEKTAQDRIKEIKTFLNLERKGRVLKLHLAKYEGLTLNEVNEVFDLYRGKKR